jgi:uncharacterized protein
MSSYENTVPNLMRMLRNLERWLDKGVAHAQAKKFEPDVLASARLAPDQFPLAKQIQAACDAAKYAAAKLSGTEPPSHPDTETTIVELRARIHTCLAYLESFQPESFAGAQARSISHQWMRGKTMRAPDYVDQFVIPNFYFHCVHTYAILRHNGVDLGKLDYLGPISLVDPS